MHTDDLLLFADRALDGMCDIVSGLGDELANTRPPLPGANSPYQVLTHCLGVMEYWAGQLIAGRAITRDRPAEFTASGPVDELVSLVAQRKQRFRDDLVHVRPGALVSTPPPKSWLPDGYPFTHEVVLLHVLEELCQHHGQMEITRDMLIGMAERLPSE
ncbi:uncharacterized protein DUF664 [Herbihabitans rhizosphaerae]|uniref:Uncharacterized protein DUF664 n=1 Tax=Herbihabitans rhizosphaerae TaxID=1872711 RepID=A0A4Q7L979_9PSEU|nr:DinB family protein [Herbihabitans rhizosphaerae]RZS44982.1 uncharacterized protein DUF664 [Herbihabitans rhizosphaerae]